MTWPYEHLMGSKGFLNMLKSLLLPHVEGLRPDHEISDYKLK